MKRLSISAAALLALAGCHHDAPLQTAASQAQVSAQVLASLAYAQYDAAGGGPFWGFNLTNNGTAFSLQYPGGPNGNPITVTGPITSQTKLNALVGNGWLFEGQTSGGEPIHLLIEHMPSSPCSDGYYDGQDKVSMTFDGYLYRGCGRLTP